MCWRAGLPLRGTPLTPFSNRAGVTNVNALFALVAGRRACDPGGHESKQSVHILTPALLLPYLRLVHCKVHKGHLKKLKGMSDKTFLETSKE